MPAKTEEQRTLMCVALAIKRGEQPRSYSEDGAELADSMSEEDLRDYCKSEPTG